MFEMRQLSCTKTAKSDLFGILFVKINACEVYGKSMLCGPT